MAVVGSITYLEMGVGADLSSPAAAVKSCCWHGANATLCTPVAHGNSSSCATKPSASVDRVEEQLSTPDTSPQAEPSQLMPLFCETPQPTTLEFRSAVKLKEKRKQRQLARSPYAGRPGGRKLGTLACGVGASVGVRRKLLEEEQQRLMQLPKGRYSRHRLSLVGKALEILGAGELDESDEDQIESLLKELSLDTSIAGTKT